MNTFQGISASGGIAKGNAFLLPVYTRQGVNKYPVAPDTVDADWARFEKAREKTLEYFQSLIDQTNSRQAAIFQTYVLMLSDPDFLGQLKKEHTEQSVCIEWVVDNKAREYAGMLRSSGDSYLIERAEDILDVYGKVIDNLIGDIQVSCESIPEGAILAARFLSPSDAVFLSFLILSIKLLTAHTSSRNCTPPPTVKAGQLTDISVFILRTKGSHFLNTSSIFFRLNGFVKISFMPFDKYSLKSDESVFAVQAIITPL